MKTVKLGEIAPWGFFKRENDTQWTWLRLPLFPWYGERYDIACDEKVRGWHLKQAFVRFAFGDSTIKETARKDFLSQEWRKST